MIYCLNPNCQQPVNSDDRLHCQQCGRILQDRLRNHYKVLDTIGRGGFGKTYLAQDKDKLDELCVVKQLVFNEQNNEENDKAKALFKQEAKQLQLLGEHPQIPMLLAYFEENSYLYLVQQFIKGENLHEKLKQEGLFRETQIKELLIDILQILKFIHSNNIIHRDIKLSNIMYCAEENKYVLIDFGISKTITSSLIQTGTSLGSQGYASPEQLLHGKATTASDLYSLGATCFHLMTGINPFKLWVYGGYHWVKNWQDYLKKPLSRELTAIVDKLIQKDIDRRYQTAEQVIEDLEPLVLGTTSSVKLKSSIKKNTSQSNVFLESIDKSSSSKIKVSFKVLAAIATVIGLKILGFNTYNALYQSKIPANNIQENNRILSFNKEDFPSGVFNYSSSSTWTSIRTTIDPAINLFSPNFELRYTEPISRDRNSDTGIKMLLENRLSFSQSSRPLKEEEYEKANRLGYTLEEKLVAIDGIAIAANHSLPIAGITLDELKDIYTGKISNWKQIGGPDLPLVAYSRNPGGEDDINFFIKNILKGENFGDNVVKVPNTTTGIRKVAKDPGGIYFGRAINIVHQCTVRALPVGRYADRFVSPYQEPLIPASQCAKKHNQLNKSAFRSGEYPLTQRLFVIVKKDGREDEKAGFAYAQLLLTPEAQKLIDKAGFVSVNITADEL